MASHMARNKCYLRAGAATCIEFKVRFDLSGTSEFFFQIANCHMITLSHRPFVQMFSPQILKWCINVCLASTTKTVFIGNSRVHRPIKIFLVDIQR